MISFEIRDAELQQAIARVIDNAKDQTRPLNRASIIMRQSVDKNFRVGGRPKWKPLAASTIKRRRKGSSRPLLNTGIHIRDTIRTESDAYSARVGPGFGPIPRVHQFGLNETIAVRSYVRKGGVTVRAHTMHQNIPARPYLVFQPEDIVRIVKLFEDHNGFK